MTAQAVHNLNLLLGFGSLILLAISLILILMLLFVPKRNGVLDFVHQNFLLLGFLAAFSASLFSLVYSEIVNFAPCYLCWLARIFMFPMAIIFGVALYYKDRGVTKYIIALLAPAFAVSLYHNFMQYFADTGNLPCDASGVSCYQSLIPEFGGHLQIPTLSLISLIALLSIVLVAHFYKKEA